MVSQNPDGSFTVTLADVYAEVRKHGDILVKAADAVSDIADHETRIRSLEKWKYALPVSILFGIADTAAAVAIGLIEWSHK